MNNFWDGSKCVSVTFIVCICAALGGSIIIILLSLVIWLGVERRRQMAGGSGGDTYVTSGRAAKYNFQ